jgi:hypothetical protein
MAKLAKVSQIRDVLSKGTRGVVQDFENNAIACSLSKCLFMPSASEDKFITFFFNRNKQSLYQAGYCLFFNGLCVFGDILNAALHSFGALV